MSQRYFDPQGLARVGHMELVARQVVEGFLTGRHRSPYHGFSVEYLDHRAYTPGDDLRSLDWKILARTGKYCSKLFQDETNLRAHILLDCSRSMAFQSGDLSKLAYGSYLAAALTYLLLRQNDAVGLVLFDRTIRQQVPPRARPTQFRRVLDLLEHAEIGGDTDVGGILHQVAERIRQRGLIILISDLIDDEAAIANGLQHFRHRHHEVIVFHVLDDAGAQLPLRPPHPVQRHGRRRHRGHEPEERAEPLPGSHAELRRNDPRRLFLPQDQLQLDQYPTTVRRAAGGLPGQAVQTGLNGWT